MKTLSTKVTKVNEENIASASPARWGVWLLVVVTVVAAILGTLATQFAVPVRYSSTELVRIYNKAEEQLPYAPVLTVADVFSRNVALASLIPPDRLHEAIQILPSQFPQLHLDPNQVEKNVTLKVVRDTPFVEITAQADSEVAAADIAGGIAANAVMLQIENHDNLNIHMESTAKLSAHRLSPTEPYFALPLAILVALLYGVLGIIRWQRSAAKLPFAAAVAVAVIIGVVTGTLASLFVPMAFLMLAAIGATAVLAFFRLEWGVFGLMALLPLHNFFRAFVDNEPWKYVSALDYWRQGMLILFLAILLWQQHQNIPVMLRNPLNFFKKLALHDKVLVLFAALGVIYIVVAPSLVVGAAGFVQDYSCFGIYLVARFVGSGRGTILKTTLRQPLKPVWLIIAAGGIVSVITIYQYLVVGTANYMIWTGYAIGTPQFNTLTTNFLYGTKNSIPIYRAVSTLMDPLVLSFYATAAALLVMSLFCFWKNRGQKLLLLAVATGLINALLLSYTRSTWVGAGLALVVLLGLAIFKGLRPASWKNALLYILVIAVVVSCDYIPWGSFVGGNGNDPLGTQGGLFGSLTSYTKATLQGSDSTSDYHINSLLDIGVKQLLLHHPLGAGEGMEGDIANHFIASGTIKNPLPWVESYYFVIAGEMGVLGLLLFLAVLATTGWDLFRNWRNSDKNQIWRIGLSVAALTALIGVAVASITLPSWSDPSVSWTLWGIVGLAFSPAARSAQIFKKQPETIRTAQPLKVSPKGL